MTTSAAGAGGTDNGLYGHGLLDALTAVSAQRTGLIGSNCRPLGPT
jgi:hypothetical protein